MIPNANEFLDLISKKEERIYKMGIINPAHIGGNPRIIFDGETEVSTKAYPYLTGYVPVAGERVFMLAVANSYLIIDKIEDHTPRISTGNITTFNGNIAIAFNAVGFTLSSGDEVEEWTVTKDATGRFKSMNNSIRTISITYQGEE